MVGRTRKPVARPDCTETWESTTLSSILWPTIEEWVAWKDNFRKTSHNLPVAHPVYGSQSKLERRFIKVYEKDIKLHLPEVLGQYQISYERACLGFYPVNYGPSQCTCTTLNISTRDEDSSLWLSAARDILNLFWEHGARQLVKSLQVEIRNPEKMYCDVSKVLPDEALIQTLEAIQPDVLKTVNSLMTNIWTSIAYHLRVDYWAAY
ncbi:hypothetical protein AJ79_08062 [Helicocarpus griseus UAMH5409]|uniref:Uncharacterized protein n=1 Tax=Helicocarpus griseus UAMH5409 TaxID=1447875 RepID=A0A2B7WWH7_9EURO|nr:hypothetical protein AJ79_08062 [Helicocarpus griseus UAMH5409]